MGARFAPFFFAIFKEKIAIHFDNAISYFCPTRILTNDAEPAEGTGRG